MISKDFSDYLQKNMLYLIETIQALSQATDLDSVMKIVRHAARQIVNADGASFILREGDKCYYADEEAISPLWKGQRFSMEVCLSGWVMLHKESLHIVDIYQDSRVPQDAYRPTFVKSLAIVPIRTAAPIGAIGTYWAEHRTVSEPELKLLQILADSTSIAIKNVELYTELEFKVKERTRQLEFLNKELAAFSYSVSHDLKAPLRSIHEFSKILLEDCHDKLEETNQDYLKRIVVSSDKMQTLIDDLLLLSRANSKEIKFDNVLLMPLIKEIITDLKSKDPDRNVTVKIQDNLMTKGDTGLLKIMLQNLIANAWKYSSKKDHAEIEIGERALDRENKVFYIKDNGAGFDMKHADKLFVAFQRLHSNTEFPGTGIGLTIVARIAERHGGKVWAESTLNEGSTFYLQLPLPG